MSSPIPDAVLRDIADHGLAVEYGHDDGSRLARELLALRSAVVPLLLRRSAMAEQCLCGYVFFRERGAKAMAEAWASHAETCSIERLRALLPKEAP